MGDLNVLFFLSMAMLVIPEVKSSIINVTTGVGVLIGVSENVEFIGENKSVSRFLGLPFAKPPIGERRFRRPEKYGILTSPYNATYFRPHCMQSAIANPSIRYFKMDEDCLYLNVFIPGNKVTTHKKYAVMVFIHGGGFTYSGSEIFSGDKLSAFNDVILVTMNYRLNTFGFLSNGTKSSGNFGLWDQKLALHWVHDNIADFGGDPEKVTLFGNSAGAASVLYQVMNPTNRGLFQRILTQSGSVLAQWTQQYNPAEMFKEFVSEVKCDMERYDDVLTCLQSKDAVDLVTARFSPVVDRDFVIEDPTTLFSKEGNDRPSSLDFFSEVDFLSGVQSRDGAAEIDRLAEQFKDIGVNIAKGVPRSIFDNQFVPSMLFQMYGDTELPLLKQSVIQQYIDWSRPFDYKDIRELVVDIWSDVAFFVPAINVLKKHLAYKKNNETSYFYVFDHKPFFDYKHFWLKGSRHGMELPYVFGMPDAMKVAAGFPPNFHVPLPLTDLKLSSIVMKFWTSFAKTGNPNLSVDTDMIDVPSWPQYNISSQSYLEITSNMTSESVKNFFIASRAEFWTNLVPLLREKCEQHTSRAHSLFKNTPAELLCFLFIQILLYLK